MMLDSLVEGIVDAMTYLAYSLPFVLLAFPLALLWRRLWRKFRR